MAYLSFSNMIAFIFSGSGNAGCRVFCCIYTTNSGTKNQCRTRYVRHLSMREMCAAAGGQISGEAQKKPDPAQNAGDRLLLPYDYSYRSQSGSAVRRIQYS